MSPKPPIIIPLNLTRSRTGEIEISSPNLKSEAFGLFYYFKRGRDRVRFGVPRVDNLDGAVPPSDIAAQCTLIGGDDPQDVTLPWDEEALVGDVPHLLSPVFEPDQDVSIAIAATTQADASGCSGGGYVRLRREGGGGPLGG